MFTQTLPAELFKTQREFIRVMGGNLDFVWAARKLVVEETEELREAYNAPQMDTDNMAHIFKELGDVIYVVAYFYNVMPPYAPELISEETNAEILEILDKAAVLVSEVSMKLQLPLPLIVACFEEVHRSNMSKLGDDGQPVRREDGKILKGPNYKPADMSGLVKEWQKFQTKQMETDNAQKH